MKVLAMSRDGKRQMIFDTTVDAAKAFGVSQLLISAYIKKGDKPLRMGDTDWFVDELFEQKQEKGNKK